MTYAIETQAPVNIFDFLPQEQKPAAETVNDGEAVAIPFNPTTKEYYKGENVFALATQAFERGYKTMEFAGYTQWLNAGRQVKKGEKSLSVKVYKKFEKINKETGEKETSGFCKGAAVFCIEQTEEIQK